MTAETRTRIRYGSLVAAAVLLILFLAPIPFVYVTCAVVACFAWHEFTQMSKLDEYSSLYWSQFFLLPLCMFLEIFLKTSSYFTLLLVIVLGFSLLVYEFLKRRNSHLKPLSVDRLWTLLSYYVLGFFYIFFLYGFITPVARHPGGRLLVLAVFLMVFGCDIGAYAIGRRFGKRKIWPGLSPSKTLEGALGGVGASLLAGLLVYPLIYYYSPQKYSFLFIIIVALLAGPLAQAGDLFESVLKRSFGVKDSGKLIPGHGGILDRTDSLVFVFPLIYFLL
ncbi:MAG: phosphatidate cytidylyltransferase [Proteobacteria bacterium]|nr:phosphatidate cytidylyltransferase [Pseudomonadota bacterium]